MLLTWSEQDVISYYVIVMLLCFVAFGNNTTFSIPMLMFWTLKAQRSLLQPTVEAAINSHRYNGVLNEHPPPSIYDNEWQSNLGLWSILNWYRERITPRIFNRCPVCHHRPHNAAHLFNCPGTPPSAHWNYGWDQQMWHNTFYMTIFTWIHFSSKIHNL